MLKIKNLDFFYQKNNIKYHYQLEAKKGDIVAIMGKSGSGKSTLLDLISGFLSPIGGSIVLDDNDFTYYPISSRPVTILFQNHNLFEHLRVDQNISVGIDGKFSITKNKQIIIADMLKEVDLTGFDKKLVSKLSGGEQQRVALARSLVRKKSILLLDEPFSSLDKQTKTQMLFLVQKITKNNNFITIMVTHDEYDANLIANKYYILKNGILQSKNNFDKINNDI